MQRLCPPQNRRQRLDGRADDIVLRLLRRQAAPRRLRVEAHRPGAGILRPVALPHPARPDPPRGAVLADLFKKVEMGVKEKRKPRGKVIHRQPRRNPRLHVGEAVGQGEGQLLHRRGARLADMVAADADRIPARHLLGGKGKDIGDQPQRGLRGKDPRFLGGILLENIVLNGAADALQRHPLLQRRRHIEAPQHRRRPVDRHRGGDLIEGDPLEEHLHILQRIDSHAAAADLSQRAVMVGIIPHDRGHVESHAQPRLALLQQVTVAPVGSGGIAKTGKLAHRPEASAVHILPHPPGKGIGAGRTEIAPIVQSLNVGGGVQLLDLFSGNRLKRPRSLHSVPPGPSLLFGHYCSSLIVPRYRLKGKFDLPEQFPGGTVGIAPPQSDSFDQLFQ